MFSALAPQLPSLPSPSVHVSLLTIDIAIFVILLVTIVTVIVVVVVIVVDDGVRQPLWLCLMTKLVEIPRNAERKQPAENPTNLTNVIYRPTKLSDPGKKSPWQVGADLL